MRRQAHVIPSGAMDIRLHSSIITSSHMPSGRRPRLSSECVDVHFDGWLAGRREIRSENSATGPAKVYKAGETFFEPPGSKHLVSENASATEPARLLAIFVADDDAQLTIYE